jgi:hypothetical protein
MTPADGLAETDAGLGTSGSPEGVGGPGAYLRNALAARHRAALGLPRLRPAVSLPGSPPRSTPRALRAYRAVIGYAHELRCSNDPCVCTVVHPVYR